MRAVPTFRAEGFRGSTVKALAAACGLSIPALYRYFPSKRAFALYPLVALYPELHAPPPDVTIGDPRSHLAGWIDAAVTEMPNYTLALRLAREVGLETDEQSRVETNLATHIDVLASLARAARSLDGATSRELATSMISIATGAALTGIDIGPTSLRRSLVALLRGYGLILAGCSTRRARERLRSVSGGRSPRTGRREKLGWEEDQPNVERSWRARSR